MDNSVAAANARARVMQNELILQLAAPKMSARALRSVRGTCGSWNSLFVSELRNKQGELELDCVDQWARRKRNRREVRKLRGWTKLMASRTTSEFPVTKYRLLDLHVARPEDLNEFFHTFGSTMTCLDLSFQSSKRSAYSEGHPVNFDSIRRIIFELAPNLRELRFRIEVDADGPDPIDGTSPGSTLTRTRDVPSLRWLEFSFSRPLQVYAKLVADIFRHSTRLQLLSVQKKFACAHRSSNMGILDALKDHTPQGCLGSLTTLKIYKLNGPELEILLELARRLQVPLRLNSFATSFEFSIDDHYRPLLENLHTFLESQADTLRHFSLEFGSGDYRALAMACSPATAKVNLPILPAVTSFRFEVHGLEPEHRGHRQLLTSPMELTFPGLIKFEYANHSKEWEVDNMEGYGHRGLSLTDLGLNTTYAPTHQFQEMFSLRFRLQSLTRLEVEVKANQVDILTQIFTPDVMPALEELQIRVCASANDKKPTRNKSGTEIDLDALLTGISIDTLGELREALDVNSTVEDDGGLQNLLQNHKTNAGIQDVRALRKFVLQFCGVKFRLTDIGGYLGFGMANSGLQHIEIKGYEPDVKDKHSYTPELIGLGHKGNCWGTEILISESCLTALRRLFGSRARIF